MTPREIQYEIRKRTDANGQRYTQGRLAREWGYDQMSLSRCIHKYHHKMTAPLIHLISEFIGRDPKAVFPEYFKPIKIERPNRRKRAL